MPVLQMACGDNITIHYRVDRQNPPVQPEELPSISRLTSIDIRYGYRNRIKIKLGSRQRDRSKVILCIQLSRCTQTKPFHISGDQTFGQLKRDMLDWLKSYYGAVVDAATNLQAKTMHLEDGQVLETKLRNFTVYDQAVIWQPTPT